jgi:hypothetical protein
LRNAAKLPFRARWNRLGKRLERAARELMHLREYIAAQLRKTQPSARARFFGACSFGDFLGDELRETDHLVNRGETGRAMKLSVQFAFA